MPNPYGITEVDVPGVIGAYETGQNNRLMRLARQQQIAAAERQAERQQRFDSLLLGRSTDGKGATGAYSQAATPQAEQVVSDLHGLPSPAPATPAAPPAPPTQPFRVPDEVLAQLVVLDPEQAAPIVNALRAMDTAQRERLSAANLYMANAAQHLRGIPLAERAAELQRIAPDLLAHGITQQQLQSFTPDDRSLDYVIQSAMDVERLAQNANPHPMVEPQGGRIIDTNRTDPRTGRPVVMSESPTIAGPNGEIYARPPEASSIPRPQTAINPRTGERIQLNPQTNQWEPVPAEAPAFRPAPGGAASGQQNFP